MCVICLFDSTKGLRPPLSLKLSILSIGGTRLIFMNSSKRPTKSLCSDEQSVCLEILPSQHKRTLAYLVNNEKGVLVYTITVMNEIIAWSQNDSYWAREKIFYIDADTNQIFIKNFTIDISNIYLGYRWIWTLFFLISGS